ncbi:hypothetical protein M885DRAFT_610027, partial [Pelagophyceae sp. CCMP2097]
VQGLCHRDARELGRGARACPLRRRQDGHGRARRAAHGAVLRGRRRAHPRPQARRVWGGGHARRPRLAAGRRRHGHLRRAHRPRPHRLPAHHRRVCRAPRHRPRHDPAVQARSLRRGREVHVQRELKWDS